MRQITAVPTSIKANVSTGAFILAGIELLRDTRRRFCGSGDSDIAATIIAPERPVAVTSRAVALIELLRKAWEGELRAAAVTAHVDWLGGLIRNVDSSSC